MIGHKLKVLRAQHNLRQIDVAKKLGVSISTYSQKEQGIREFTVSEINKILELFNVSYEEIFK